MFSKRVQRNSGGNSRFYQTSVEEVQSGYLYKSPPPSLVFRNLKSWKRRYFVLSESSENMYELKFFKDESREKLIGKINICQITLLFLCPDSHTVWPWIEKNFRCSASCVLFMKVLDRDYFLIGQNSRDMDCWFDAISTVRNTYIPRMVSTEEQSKNGKPRSISEPIFFHSKESTRENDQKPSERHSTPDHFNTQDIYDIPRKLVMPVLPSQESEDIEDDEECEIKEPHETETANCYMEMRSVREVVREFETDITQTKLTGEKDTENLLLNYKSDSTSTSSCGQIPPQHETVSPVQKDICLNREDLRSSVIFSENGGRPCVSDWKQVQSPGLFHEGDQILAINDLLTDSLDELHTYLKRLSRDEVKLTILRTPGSRPLNGCCAENDPCSSRS